MPSPFLRQQGSCGRQDRTCPIERKEDVAGPLNLPQQLEAWLDVLLGMAAAERVIQKSQAIGHPPLVLAVLDARKAGKKCIARPRIRRQGRHDEREARLSIWIDDTRVLRGQDRVCCIHVAQRQFLRHVDEIVFRKREPSDRLLPAPHAVEEGNAGIAW